MPAIEPQTAELLALLAAIRIEPPGVQLAGRIVPAEFGGPGSWPRSATQDPLVRLLQNGLYQYGYCHRFRDDWTPPHLAYEDVTASLRSANPSRDRWEAGWRLLGPASDGRFRAARGGDERLVWPGEFMNYAGAGGPPQGGATISVYCPREATGLQPGFYHAFGEIVADDPGWDGLRYYWNTSLDGARG